MILPILAVISLVAGHETARFKKLLNVMFENTDVDVAMRHDYFEELVPKGRYYRNMHGIAHPSQPNYIAQIAGSDFGLLTDDNIEIEAENLVDLLERNGHSWKTYQENYPGDCNTVEGTADNLYKRKHNPFMSMNNIRLNSTRCAKIVDEKQFQIDVAQNNLPDYMYYVPNQIHDGHDLPPYPETSDNRIAKSSKWLTEFLTPILANPIFNETLIIITFDENDVNEHDLSSDEAIENLIYTVVLGAGVQVGSHDNTYFNQYSNLALIEREWCLGNLGRNDSITPPFTLSDNEVSRVCPGKGNIVGSTTGVLNQGEFDANGNMSIVDSKRGPKSSIANGNSTRVSNSTGSISSAISLHLQSSTVLTLLCLLLTI